MQPQKKKMMRTSSRKSGQHSDEPLVESELVEVKSASNSGSKQEPLLNYSKTTSSSGRSSRLSLANKVSSPYKPFALDGPTISAVRCLLLIFRLTWRAGLPWLIVCGVASVIMATLDALTPVTVSTPLRSILYANQKSRLPGMLVFMTLYNSGIAIAKAAANYAAIRYLATARLVISKKLHALYMDPKARNYYVMNNLDKQVSNPGSALTSDLDLTLQFGFEFVLGGVMKPDSGAIANLLACFGSIVVAWDQVARKGSPGMAWLPGTLSVAFALLTVFPTRWVSARLTRALDRVQEAEGNFRLMHTKIRTFCESISFYGGEKSELTRIQGSAETIWKASLYFAAWKCILDCIQLLFYFGNTFIAASIALCISQAEGHLKIKERTDLFEVLFQSSSRCMMTLLNVTKASLDCVKAMALASRVVLTLEVMESFLWEESLIEDQRVEAIDMEDVRFEKCTIFTPDATRLLMKNVTLDLKIGESCLIMGPSGIGKSSLLRVLGKLWPLFRSPDDVRREATFCRPGMQNMFFIAQRPYIFAGTLREQVAYPMWEKSLLDELTDKEMETLFEQANLADVWTKRCLELDKHGIEWAEVLSLGEQQRVQFCRLFWHYNWFKRHRGSQGFFAVLDESTASLDTESEMAVYSQCRSQGLGYLSVAHRPTVIQYHTKVLNFYFDSQNALQWAIRDGMEFAKEAAEKVSKASLENNVLTEDQRNSLIGELPKSKTFLASDNTMANIETGIDSPYSGKVEDEGSRRCGGVKEFFWMLKLMSSYSAVSNFSCLMICTLACAIANGMWPVIYAIVGQTAKKDPNEEGSQRACIKLILLLLGYGTLKAVLKSLSNFFSMRSMVKCRQELTGWMQAYYMDSSSRSYYVLNQLDTSLDNVDQRISSDVDLFMQYFFEFGPGGVLKAESGIFFNLLVTVFLTHTMLSASYDTSTTSAGLNSTDSNFTNSTSGIPETASSHGIEMGLKGALFAFGWWAATLPASRCLGAILSRRQATLQKSEAFLKVSHSRVTMFSESIAFYGGEGSEASKLDKQISAVVEGWRNFAKSKFALDFISLLLYYSQYCVAAAGAVILIFMSVSCPDTDEGRMCWYGPYTTLKQGMIQIIKCLTMAGFATLDYAKARAFYGRVLEMVVKVEAYYAFSANDYNIEKLCCNIEHKPVKLQCSPIIEADPSAEVRLRHCSIFTPDGRRQLVQSVSLELKKKDSCLIMGPSGIGKSSLLRVLGQLWPLFFVENQVSCEDRSASSSQTTFSVETTFRRPGPRSVFFLAQRPYIFSGTLREQVAYPMWDSSLLDDLTDREMERLFEEASLQSVWMTRKDELDTPGIEWADVLSLGEQQRLQFCRLFWHYEWHSRQKSHEGFYAVLDESTASLDTDSEIAVYSKCKEKGMGFLSVAHRPTVIQYHTNVLFFYFDDGRLEWKLLPSDTLAGKVAHQIVGQTPSLKRSDS